MRIAGPEQLSDGQTVTFEFLRDGRKVEGFLARFAGQLVAYENVCRHIPISLDYGDKQFFSRDGKYFICRSHGAVYEPLSGECIQGPCVGDRLKPLDISIEPDGVWLMLENG